MKVAIIVASLIIGASVLIAAGLVAKHLPHECRTSAPANAVSTSPPPPAAAPQVEPSTKTLDIQVRIDKTPDGGTISIPFGRYILEKGLVIRKRKDLTLRSEKGTQIFVDDVQENVVSIAGSSGITIENGHFRHLKPLGEYECHGNVIDVRDSDTVRIEDAELDGCGAVGVFAAGTKRLTVKSCHIHHNTFNAFYLSECRGVRIVRCTVEDNKNFLQCYDVSDFEMQHNVIQRNGGYWPEEMDFAGHSEEP